MLTRKNLFGMLAFAAAFGLAPANAQTVTPDPFVGTWIIKINESRTGLPVFRAMHTYHGDGTISENSSLLPQLNENPAQGIWRRDGTQYKTVFQLFVYDDKKEYAGMVRVRGTVTFITADRIQGNFVVDFLSPDGAVDLNIDSADAVGVRLKLDSLSPALP